MVKFWDKSFKNFAIKAKKGVQYRAVAQEGRLRMAFTVTALFADSPPETLMLLLLRQNPGLPSGALTFISWVVEGGPSSWTWTYVVSVTRGAVGTRCLR